MASVHVRSSGRSGGQRVEQGGPGDQNGDLEGWEAGVEPRGGQGLTRGAEGV